MQPNEPSVVAELLEEVLARRYSAELRNRLIAAEQIPETIVELRSCRT